MKIKPTNTTVRRDGKLFVCGVGEKSAVSAVLVLVYVALLGQAGCKSPAEYRQEADKTAYDIIRQKQREAIGNVENFTIERPSDILRRRLLEGQNLQYSGPWSLGSDRLEKPKHWPQDDYPEDMNVAPLVPLEGEEPITFTLLEALQVAARNSFSYQTQKEDIFRTAFRLDLERDLFRDFFTQQVSNLVSTDGSGDRTVSGTRQSSVSGLSRTLKNGASFSAQLAVDLANLLTLGGRHRWV